MDLNGKKRMVSLTDVDRMSTRPGVMFLITSGRRCS